MTPQINLHIKNLPYPVQELIKTAKQNNLLTHPSRPLRRILIGQNQQLIHANHQHYSLTTTTPLNINPGQYNLGDVKGFFCTSKTHYYAGNSLSINHYYAGNSLSAPTKDQNIYPISRAWADPDSLNVFNKFCESIKHGQTISNIEWNPILTVPK